MRIGINAVRLTRRLTGIGHYLYWIIKYLEKIDKENEYFLYVPERIKLPFSDNPRWHQRVPYDFGNKILDFWLFLFWSFLNCKTSLKKDNIDVFWNPEHIFPARLPFKTKNAITVHDLTHSFFPETKSFISLSSLFIFFRKSLIKADRIITDSKAVSLELSEYLLKNRISDCNRVITIPLGVDKECFRPCDKFTSAKFISDKYGIKNKFILTVSTLEPRKNLVNLLIAFRDFVRMDNSYQLLIAGSKGWKYKPIFKTCNDLGLNQKVCFLGYVEDGDFSRLYSAADIFVLPSLYEGFGMPLLEAMSCGIPCVCSDINVFKEVAGEAAVYFDPKNTSNISQSIKKVIMDESLKDSLIKKGHERSKLFSWENSARGMLRVFNELNQE